jgi:ABC-2 type transport system permease protein
MMMQFGGGGGEQGKQFKALEKKLEENYSPVQVDLEKGVVSNNVDILLILAPKNLKEKQLFAVDQFLMKGGTVVLATSPIAITKGREGFNSEEYDSGLTEWLNHHGVSIPKELVLDTKNAGFPSMRKRIVQGVTIREPYLAPYPFFVDVRNKALNQDNGITSGLNQITMAWASPLEINAEANKTRKVTSLLKSSQESWKSSDINIEPNRDLYPETGFQSPEKHEPHVLGAVIEGNFSSYFTGKENPLLVKAPSEGQESAMPSEDSKKEDTPTIAGIIEKSADSARLILFASNEFITDDTVQITSMVNGSQYTNALQLVENSLDWSTEDRSLLSIRSRGHFARTLDPLTDTQKQRWEILNYLFALLGLLLIYGGYRYLQRQSIRHREKFRPA